MSAVSEPLSKKMFYKRTCFLNVFLGITDGYKMETMISYAGKMWIIIHSVFTVKADQGEKQFCKVATEDLWLNRQI